MLYPSKVKHLGERAITSEHNSEWYDKAMFNRDPDLSSGDKWKNNLTLDQQVRISKHFKNHKELNELGYDFSLSHLKFLDKIRGEIVSYVRCHVGEFRIWLTRVIGGGHG